MEAKAIFLNLFTVCSSCKRNFAFCPFVYKETNGSYQFSNRLNGLNRLFSYMCLYMKYAQDPCLRDDASHISWYHIFVFRVLKFFCCGAPAVSPHYRVSLVQWVNRLLPTKGAAVQVPGIHSH
jgi:hypothetical protein